jgi:hypothetical protein
MPEYIIKRGTARFFQAWRHSANVNPSFQASNPRYPSDQSALPKGQIAWCEHQHSLVRIC